MTQTNITHDEQLRNRSLQVLAEGFKQDFAESVISNDKFAELIHELASEYVDNNIPVVREEDQTDLAFLLFEKLRIITY